MRMQNEKTEKKILVFLKICTGRTVSFERTIKSANDSKSDIVPKRVSGETYSDRLYGFLIKTTNRKKTNARITFSVKTFCSDGTTYSLRKYRHVSTITLGQSRKRPQAALTTFAEVEFSTVFRLGANADL